MANLAQDFARFYLTIRPYLIFASVPSVGGQTRLSPGARTQVLGESSGDTRPTRGLARYTTLPVVDRPRARPGGGPPTSGGASEGARSLEGGSVGFPPPSSSLSSA